MKQEARTLGEGGLLLLGEKYTGRQVLVTEEGEGVWIVKTAAVIPDSERWLHEPGVQEKIARGLEWMEQNPPRATTPEEIEALFERALEGK